MSLIIPPELPRRGNRFSVWFGKTLLKLSGWRLDGELPNQGKLMLIAAPHTSNWDFPFAMSAILAMKVDVRWIGKHTLFRRPFGSFFRFLGGMPVDRTSTKGLVATCVTAFESNDKLIIGMAPEGTRSKVTRWHTGFYHIALGAGVPVVCAAIDYKARTITLGPSIKPSGDLESDFAQILRHYQAFTPRKPENF